MSPTSQEFKDLQAEWYGKLKESGFQDTEINENFHSHHFVKELTGPRRASLQEYFAAASDFLHTHKFESELDSTVWDMYCEGLTGDDISLKLRQLNPGIQGLKATQIYLRLSKLKTIMVSRWKK